MEDHTVIVLDNSNYNSSYAEETPFKAKVTDEFDNGILVKSLVTDKEYELYPHQILEYLEVEQIKKLIDMKNYGEM